LIEVDLGPLHRPVLGIAAGGVGDLAELDDERGCRLRRDEVEGSSLAPGIVADDPVAEGVDFFLER
jgi:hypothetical protein